MAQIHMIPTQKTWDAAVNGELNGLSIMGDGELVKRPSVYFEIAKQLSREWALLNTNPFSRTTR